MRLNKKVLPYLLLFCFFCITGCGLSSRDKDPLDSSKPITVTVWHYYNGIIKDRFDGLVEKFNETIGMERGVVVDAQSLGDVNQLANAVFEAVNQTIGSLPLPDLFMSYPENAFRVNQVTELLNIDTLFSEEELMRYRPEFLDEGRFGLGKELLIFPIAKSSENLYVNKTIWDDFSNETGADVKKLQTWEGLVEISQLYYEKTGKAFLGIDANANFMLISSMQLGTELYSVDNGIVTLNFPVDIARNIWKNYYLPYIHGYFEKNGRFSSDDARTNTVMAYTGSTAGAAYFPTEVTLPQGGVYPIEPMTLPYPYFKSGKAFAFQQGAGMCISKSDAAHEFGAVLFLKWFTDPAQNIGFAVSTGYMPVMNESLKKDKLIEAVRTLEIVGKAIPKMIESTVYMMENYTLYSNKPFEGSYEFRALLESHLFDKISRDLEWIDQEVKAGENRSELIEKLSSEPEFEKWYNQIKNELSIILKK